MLIETPEDLVECLVLEVKNIFYMPEHTVGFKQNFPYLV